MTELPRPAYTSARRAWARRPPRGVYNHKTMRSWRSWRGLVALLLGTTLSEALLAPCAPKSPSYGRRSGFNLHMTGSPGHQLTKTDLKPAADLLPVPAFGKGSARKSSDTRGSGECGCARLAERTTLSQKKHNYICRLCGPLTFLKHAKSPIILRINLCASSVCTSISIAGRARNYG